MKTKLLIGMFAAVGMMLATSCSNDEQIVQSGNEAKVTFSLGLENAMNTRAISDGTGINQLFYAIFDSEGTEVASYENEGSNTEFPYNTSISLAKGEEYTAVFWAWDDDCKAYTVSGDHQSVSINYDNALNNDETRDAFFKSVTFTLTDNVAIDVVLKRAFAQLNVGITEAEWNAIAEQKGEIAKSAVVIKQAATTLNLMDGSVTGAQEITFAADAIPTEELSVDVNCDGEPEEYKYLSMCYFLVNDANSGSSKATLDDLEFTFYSADDTEIATLAEGFANAPVQRNHRTNIISSPDGDGGMLTGKLTVNVVLDPLYDGEHTLTDVNVWEEYAGIYTEEALVGKTIEIPAGWHIRNGYILEPMPENWTAESTPLYAKSYTIDGKNNTVTFEPYTYDFVAKNAFAAADGQQVTVLNLTFAGEHFGVFGGVYGGISGRKDYNTTFENVTIENNGIYYYNKYGDIPNSAFSNLGSATLKNCTIKGTYWVGATKDENQLAEGVLSKYGGIFDVFVPNDGTNKMEDCEIGSIYVNNHGKLILSGITTVDKIVSKPLVNGTITIEKGTTVSTMDIDQYSQNYPPTVTIESGAKVGTLQLNSINKTKINIAADATIDKIIWNNTEYTSIVEFNNANN